MTATATQMPLPTPQVNQPTTTVPQPSKPIQSFKDVMQQVQKSQETIPQDTKVTQEKPITTSEVPTEFVEATAIPEGIVIETNDVQNQGLMAMFEGLFGIAASEVDYTQDDIDILKDLLGKLKDPEQQFAVMLMMAFLQANPDYTLNDLAQNMSSPEAMTATAASPVTTVMNAIMKLMTNDDVKSFPLFEQAREIKQAGIPLREALVTSLMRELGVTVVNNKPHAEQSQDDPQAALYGQERFRNAVQQVKQAIITKPIVEKNTDIEHLQQQVDSGTFLRNVNVPIAKAIVTMPTGPEFVEQLRTGMTANLTNAKSEFVMQLKPEGLGEMTVKLTEVAGKLTLTIAAANTQTQKLLENQLPNLREVMKPYDVQVSQVISSKEDATAKFGGAFGEQFSEHQHQQESGQQKNFWLGEDMENVTEVATQKLTGTETIDTYI